MKGFTQQSAIDAGKKSRRGPGKVPSTVKEKIMILMDNYDEALLKKDLLALKPKDRLLVLQGLAEFVIPKLQRKEVERTNINKKVHVIEIEGETFEV